MHDGAPYRMALKRKSPLTPEEGKSRWTLVVFCLAVLTYLPSLTNGAVWDDHQLLAGDIISGEKPWWLAFTLDYWNLGKVWSDSGGYYRPLTALSLRLDYLLGAGAPLPFHITSILLHGLASAAVFPLALRFGASRVAAQLASVLFAVNPHEAETVAWISGRPDLLMTTALLWALVLRGPWSLVLGVCALLSKEAAVVWPVLAALRDRQLLTKTRIVEGTLVAAYLGVRSFVLGNNSVRLFDLDPLTGLRAFFSLMGTWLYPPLTPYAFTPILSWADSPVSVWLGLGIALALVGLFVLVTNSRRALLAFAITHAPAALLMCSRAVLGMRPLYAAAAFLSIAVCIPASSLIAPLSLSKQRIITIPMTLALAVWCGVFSRRWNDDLSYQTRAAAASPNSLRVQLNLAVAQRDSGLLQESWETTARAQSLGPYEGISFVRGQLMEIIGCSTNALQEYQRAATISPSFSIAQAAATQLAQLTPTPEQCSEEDILSRFSDGQQLARETSRLVRMHRTDLAQYALKAAEKNGATGPGLALSSAQLLYLQGKPREAIPYARSVLAQDPNSTPAMKILGLALIDSDSAPAEGRVLLQRYLDESPSAPDRVFLTERIRTSASR